jgi:bifunctional N-acetylglucosamine-1-phosphate-uridyltransferase/glucosamine-1-phosphate-acetyltransferase GlmU-like protein
MVWPDDGWVFLGSDMVLTSPAVMIGECGSFETGTLCSRDASRAQLAKNRNSTTNQKFRTRILL